MLDLRIYRTSLLAVVLAAIVVAFALQGEPAPLGTTLVPDAFNGQNAYANMVDLTRPYGHRRAGSSQDQALARVISARLHGDGFAVTRKPFEAATPAGRRRLVNVVAVRQGMANPAIVIVAHRDALHSPALAEQSGTGVLLELGRVLSGETLNHTVVLVSTTGSTGTAGATQLAASLRRPVDAVLVLGDMAGTDVTRPLVVPFSNGQQVAPPLLRVTVTAALRSQAGLSAGGLSLAAQLAHLAFPLALTEQGPLNAHGMPAVLISASGEKPPAADEPVSRRYIERFGRTTLELVDALDSGVRVPAASAYIGVAGKEIPAWAMRLLVLALILPVAATALDGLARSRRRGYAVARPLAWVGAAACPFLAVLAIVLVGKAAGLSGVAPPGPVGPGAVPIHTGDAVLLAVLAAVIAAGFALIWARGGIRALGGATKGAPASASAGGVVADENAPRARRDARGVRQRGAPVVGDPGAASAILITSCVLALVVWGANPFAALLLVPALHLWMAALATAQSTRPAVRIVLLALGLAPPALLIAYYALTLGFGPIDLAWSGVLMVAGGHIGILEAILLCLLMGCAVSAAVNAVGTSWAFARFPPDTTPVTVRPPIRYAGPGSLERARSSLSRGGSALRR